MNLISARGTRRASSRPSRPARRPARTRGTPAFACPRAVWPPYRTVVSIEYMATRRDELTREAARLFAERGFHGTSMGDLAQAIGVQKGSLYSLIGSKQELLFETMREGAAAFHAALDAVPEDAPAVERIRLALRGHLARRRRAARRRDGLHARVALPRGRAPRRDPRRAAPLRGALARALPRGRRGGRAPHRPRRRRRGAARPLGGELGVHVARAGPRHGRARRPLPAILVDGIRGYATPRVDVAAR